MSNDFILFSETFDYELLDFELDQEIVLPVLPNSVADDSEADASIMKDSNGIPLGDSMEDIKLRSEIIRDFFHKWKELHPEQMVYNEQLKENH